MINLMDKEKYLREYAGEILYESNLQLAINYWIDRIRHGVNSYSAQSKAKVIAGAATDIPGYYEEKGNLDNMSVRGIGRAITGDLERIIKNGLNKPNLRIAK